jgi:hypothetical protein
MNKIVLYFTSGVVPTEQETAEAQSLGAMLRNGSAVGDNDYVEKCDAVAGDVPEAYRQRFPVIDAGQDHDMGATNARGRRAK